MSFSLTEPLAATLITSRLLSHDPILYLSSHLTVGLTAPLSPSLFLSKIKAASTISLNFLNIYTKTISYSKNQAILKNIYQHTIWQVHINNKISQRYELLLILSDRQGALLQVYQLMSLYVVLCVSDILQVECSLKLLLGTIYLMVTSPDFVSPFASITVEGLANRCWTKSAPIDNASIITLYIQF